ncbi:hypothetical protein A1O1_09229 [Capronia coronata CBS 617.96]|uniref:Amino acid permease/ SLC12A domain-containing protein n=1 Tax=Capronia coronata CBS 617.96 TaxID=1182541 RepID=W9XEE8_9EURO|nr:uncharacterized protein A1O1_09229 [Capronia coronata CBS 617.96]EXJ78827.1 hypothetical protein A1O1_09229 [Capronia coronata CBS 617.96]
MDSPTKNQSITNAAPARAVAVKDATDIEPGNDNLDPSSHTHAIDDVFADSQVKLRRGLHGRSITIMGLAGAIGTGLFLGSGKAVTNGGAVGAVLGYTVMGVAIGCMMMCLGEMTVFRPHAGSIVSFAGDFVDDSFAFAFGWTYYLFPAIIPAVELVAAAILIQYWDTNSDHMAIYLVVMMGGVMACNMLGSRWFGELEAGFGILKVTAIVGLIILGLVIDLGGAPNKDRLGFRYWKEYPFNDDYLDISNKTTARFLGFWAVLTQAAFSYGGVELIALAAGEAQNPRVAMASVYRRMFLRIGLLYVVSMWIISMCVPRNDPNLLAELASGKTSVAESPFVIMINRAGISVLPHIINAVVLTSAFSAGNFSFFMGSRMLVALGRQGYGPKALTRVTKNGVPIYGFVIQSVFLCLSFLALSNGPNKAFNWLSNLTTLCNMICWTCVCVCFIRFHKACVAQGVDRKSFVFRSYFQPYLAWATMIFIGIVMFFNGFATFIGEEFDYQNFIVAYITLVIFAILYVGYRLIRRTKLIPIMAIDLSY